MSISRRDFLKGTAAGALSLTTMGLLGGCSSNDDTKTNNNNGATATTQPTTTTVSDGTPAWLGTAPSVKDSQIKDTWKTSLLIIGAGNGGLMAAVKAADLGIDFRIIEQNSVICDTRKWYGAINTKDCKEAGLKVDTAKLRSEFSRYASGKIDQRVFNVWLKESAAMHDYVSPILKKYDFVCDFSTDTGKDAEGETLYYRPAQEHYWHIKDEKSKYATWSRNTVFEDVIKKKGYGVDFNTSLVELVKDGKKITGAIVQNVETEEYIKIEAEAVLIATGGYPGNPEMIEAIAPTTAACVTACSFNPSDRGQGIKAAMWAGAAKDIESAPMIFDRGLVAPGVDAGYETDKDGNKAFRGKVRQFNPGTQPFMKVNRDGVRFANEHCPYNDITFAASTQKGGVYAQIFDSNVLEDVQRFNTLGCSAMTRKMGPALLAEGGPIDQNIKDGYLMKADTIEELADKLGFEGDAKKAFLKSVEKYNKYYDKQEDEEFGKPAYTLSAIRKGPFYGGWLGGSLLTTCDGIRINDDMQALTPEGDVLEGLYVTGDASGSMFANNYPELMPGVACGRTLTFALHAVDKMVKDGMKTGVGPSDELKKAQKEQVVPMTAEGLKDGTYKATGKGIEGDIPVSVTIKGGKITKIDADYSKETPSIGVVHGKTIVELIEKANGTVGVDAISGATITTGAIIKAVNKCLAQAK
ncbi:fumarate reductase flavoprotein subunit [Lachnospiraceae bacterium KM106-2]|nr:fumarate reductase flavoprotein subunit [Lachnospiraceae bacterium KM106-2]